MNDTTLPAGMRADIAAANALARGVQGFAVQADLAVDEDHPLRGVPCGRAQRVGQGFPHPQPAGVGLGGQLGIPLCGAHAR